MSRRRNDEWVSVRISGSERAQLERLAEAEERTMNGMIRLAVRELLASRANANGSSDETQETR
jgi:predicted transcriptional regulator